MASSEPLPPVPNHWRERSSSERERGGHNVPGSEGPAHAPLQQTASGSSQAPLVSPTGHFSDAETVDITSQVPTRQGSMRRPNGNEIQRYFTHDQEPPLPRRSEELPGPPRSIYNGGETRRMYRDAYPDRETWYDDDPRRPPRSGAAYRRRPINMESPRDGSDPNRYTNNGRRRSSEASGYSPTKGVAYSQDDRIYYYSDEEKERKRHGDHEGGGGFYRSNSSHHGRLRPSLSSLRSGQPKEALRLPWTMWMNSDAKNHFVASVGEFVGTTMFLFFAFAGTQIANAEAKATSATNTLSTTELLYIALAFAFSLMVNVWIFFRISGGLFNPAVTLAMLMTKTITFVRSILLLISQIAGSIFASFLVSVIFPTSLNVRTKLDNDTSLARGIVIEAILTAELVFTIFMLAREKHRATFIAPVGIGLALFIAELVGVFYTGGSLNPARSFGPCVVTGVYESEHWIYWLGPAVGAIIAVIFYRFIKILEYEMANPGQDDDEGAKKNPKSDPEKGHK